MNVFFCMQISMNVCYKLILWFWWRWSSIPKVPKIASFQCLYLNNISKKKLRDEDYFLHADKHQSLIQVDFSTLGIKVFYKVVLPLLIGMIKHSQSTQSKKFASLQYLHNISKKKLGMEFIFCVQINIKVSTNWHYCFSWKWPDMSKVWKIKSW